MRHARTTALIALSGMLVALPSTAALGMESPAATAAMDAGPTIEIDPVDEALAEVPDTVDPAPEAPADPAPGTPSDTTPSDPADVTTPGGTAPGVGPAGEAVTPDPPPVTATDVMSAAQSQSTVTFTLANAAAPYNGTYRGATLHATGLRDGTPVVENHYSAANLSFPALSFDDGSTVDFVVNYLVNASGQNGGGIGKVTGSYTVGGLDAGDVSATTVRGGAVTATVAAGTGGTTLTLANPTALTAIEYTVGLTRSIRFVTTPGDATVTIVDQRDGSWLPENWTTTASGNPRFAYALAVPVAVNDTHTYTYAVERDGFVTATGTLSATRTTTSTGGAPVLAAAPSGDEASAVLSTTSMPYPFTIELAVAQRSQATVAFTIPLPSGLSPDITLTGAQSGPVTAAATGQFVIPAADFDQVFDYRIAAPGFRTLAGSVRVGADGVVSDDTDAAARATAITYAFDGPTGTVSARLRPETTIAVGADGTLHAEVNEKIEYLFADRIVLGGSRITGGTFDLVNPLPYDVVLSDATLAGNASLAHDVLRTASPPVQTAIGSSSVRFSAMRDIVDVASAAFPGQSVKSPGSDFLDYSDYLLYYFRADLGGTNLEDYSTLTDLADLHVLDMSMIYSGNVHFAPTNGVSTFDLASEAEIGVPYITTGTTSYVMIENDPVVAALGLDLVRRHGLYFTLDDTLAPGTLPMTHTQVTTGQYRGLQYQDYLDRTPENVAAVQGMVDGIVIPAGGRHTFENVSMSVIGSYQHNGYQVNELSVDLSLTLRVGTVPPGPLDPPGPKDPPKPEPVDPPGPKDPPKPVVPTSPLPATPVDPARPGLPGRPGAPEPVVPVSQPVLPSASERLAWTGANPFALLGVAGVLALLGTIGLAVRRRRA